jgi:hypothetical protein
MHVCKDTDTKEYPWHKIQSLYLSDNPFLSLFQKCFDHKPRMISKRNKDNSAACSHPVTKHEFEDNKYVGASELFVVAKYIPFLDPNKTISGWVLVAHGL